MHLPSHALALTPESTTSFDRARRGQPINVGDSQALSALTLLVAVCEQAILELDRLEQRLEGATDAVERMRDDAVALARTLQLRSTQDSRA